MAQPPIGIDLGTSTSEIAVYQKGVSVVIADPDSPTRSLIVPSIAAVDRSGRVLVGEAAHAYVDLPGHGVRQVKRLMGTSKRVTMGGQEYRPQEIGALVLKHLKANAEQSLGVEVRQVVISVPANFADAARQATRDAAELAGLEVVRLINEPTAAALAFGVQSTTTEGQVIVFDFGGGTLDITVLEMMEGVLDVKASFGDPFLGGKDFDEAMIELISGRFRAQYPNAETNERSRADLRTAAEAAKIHLTRHLHSVVRCANFGVQGGRPVDLELEISREDFCASIAPLLDKARAVLRSALKAGKIRPSDIEHVLLVGGTTYIPAVRELVAEFFAREPHSEIHPDLAVAQGAAAQAALVAGVVQGGGPILTDVCPFGLGISIVAQVGRHLIPNMYETLIAPNTTIPYSVTRQYSLLHDEQTAVVLRLYQDHQGNARTIEDALPTGLEASITDIPLAADGRPHKIQVEFAYDLNGMIHLNASIPATGHKAALMSFCDNSRRLSLEDKTESTKRLEELWKSSPLAKRFSPILKRAEKVLQGHPGERERVEKLVKELKDALADNHEAIAEKAGDQLTDLLFDLEDS